MKKYGFFVLTSIVILFAVVILYFIWPQFDSSGHAVVSDEILITFKDNCSRCHGQSGEGFEEFPALKGTSKSVTELKKIIREGQGSMPPFSNIRDPLLTGLAEYVHSL